MGKACPFRKNRNTPAASAVTGSHGVFFGCSSLACELAEIVRVVVADEPAGVTDAGLKLHVVPVSNPEQAKLTAELKPFCGVTVRVVVTCPPEEAVSEVGEAASVKFAGEVLIVYVAEATALFM